MKSPQKYQKDFHKPKNFRESLLKLIIYCKQFAPIIIICIILAILSSVLSVIGPNKLSDMTNLILNNMFLGIDLHKIAEIGIFLVCIYSLSAIFNAIQGVLMASISQKVAKKLRSDINNKLLKLPFKYLDSDSYGNFMSKTTNDVDAIGQGLNDSIASLIGAIALLLASMIMMFVTNWIMALTAIGASLIGFVLMGLILSKSQKHFTTQQKSLGEVNGHIEEVFTAHDIIKSYNATSSKKSQFDTINNELYDSAWKSQFMSGIMPSLMAFIGNFGYVAVCVVGAFLVTNGTITIGTIIAFILYARLFSNPLSQIAQAFSFLQSTSAASGRVFDLLSQNEIENDTNIIEISPQDIKGNVEFNHVKFSYDGTNVVIKDFSVHISQGQKVAIVGPTGSGKTTLVNLLMRFYELQDGEIKIDDHNIKEINRNTLHNIFGMVLQDTWLFEGSIRQNIVFNQQNVSEDRLLEICQLCGLTHFINTLPNGMDTILDDNTAVSVGQKQLITIARAMLQNCPMLILDEATSSIDTRTEILIQNAMDKLTEKRTSFVIAHRLSTIKNADLILVMKGGEIVEQGSHNQLLSQNGFYTSLYNSQFDVEE